MKTLLLEQMTSPQVRDAIQSGYRTVIVAAGSIEQHGKHLPIGTDAMAGYITTTRLAEELGDALVAPVIRPGCSDHHMAFAGTISIPPELLQELCWAYCRNLYEHGFERIVLITTHGGNSAAMEAVTPEIDAELPCRVVWVSTYHDARAVEARESVLARYEMTSQEGGEHAGFSETSVLLASSYGQWAQMGAAQRGFVGDGAAKIEELKTKGSWNIADISQIGVLGDPTHASAEAGEDLMDASIPILAQAVREALGSDEE